MKNNQNHKPDKSYKDENNQLDKEYGELSTKQKLLVILTWGRNGSL